MKERPILFSAPMVRAILNGTKSQTRRVFKAQNGGLWPRPNDLPGMRQILRECPYGKPGDRLWVRETWAYHVQAIGSVTDKDGPWVYASDGDHVLQHRLCDRWRPSIHMPRAASRITLEITGVCVERLQDISEADAIAEGIERADDFFGCQCWKVYGEPEGADVVAPNDPIGSYRSLWEFINGTGSWDANPWVWAVEFKRI